MMCTVSPIQTEKSMVGSMMSIMETVQPARLMMPMVRMMLMQITATGAMTVRMPLPMRNSSRAWSIRQTRVSLTVSLRVILSLS